MSITDEQPSLEDFLSAPIELIRQVAPQTLVLGAGGTRRRAVLAGKSSSSNEYASWTRHEMMSCLNLIFAHGVEHIIAPMLLEGSFRETTSDYREQLAAWVRWGLGDERAIADYARLNWRVRLLGTESWPDLADLAAELVDRTEQHTGPTVWFTVMSRPEFHWAFVLKSVIETQPSTAEEAIKFVYGEDVPPATLYLGSGKPDLVPSVVPPLLIGDMHCYWRQHLGFDMTEALLRRILYDYAYARRTWRSDKTGRADEVLNYSAAWTDPPVIGLGFRLGPFWYPTSFALPPEIAEEQEKWISGPSS